MDIVVPVRVGNVNESLRYALRSYAANIPHDQIWLVGHKPLGLKQVEHLPTVQSGTKYANTTLAMRTACEHPGVSDPFIFAADDVFAMKPIEVPIAAYHRGPVTALEAYYQKAYGRSAYLWGMKATRELLEKLGHANPLSYELHVPLTVHKDLMLPVLDLGKSIPGFHKRTAYCVVNRLGGSRMRDPKVIGPGSKFDPNAQFLSTMPASFRRGGAGMHIRRVFTEVCRYEQALSGRPPQRRTQKAGRR